MRRLALLFLLPAALHGAEKRVWLEGDARREFLDAIEKSMTSVETFVAEFEQKKTLALFDDTVTSRGFLLFQRPDRLRWEFRDPFKSILVVVGDEVAKFEFVGERRRALELGRAGDAVLAVMSRIRRWFDGKFDRSGKTYEVHVSRKPSLLLRLVPKDKALRKNLRAIELVPSRDFSAIVKVTIFERGGDRTEMAFSKRAHGVKPPERAFSLEDPRELDLKKLRATAR